MEAGDKPNSGVPVVGPPSDESGGSEGPFIVLASGGGGASGSSLAESMPPVRLGIEGGPPKPNAPRIAERGAFSSVETDGSPPSIGASCATSTESPPSPGGFVSPRLLLLLAEPPSESTALLGPHALVLRIPESMAPMTASEAASDAAASAAASKSAGAPPGAAPAPRLRLLDRCGDGTGNGFATAEGTELMASPIAAPSSPPMAASAAPKSTRNPDADGVSSDDRIDGDIRNGDGCAGGGGIIADGGPALPAMCSAMA
mmetsp:Transcript_46595/g.122343  ORF Transcript_46595/g.122343 Transcript_46595/m.122343 type:complete len:259 (-) Transcript_46595:124-900(-)